MSSSTASGSQSSGKPSSDQIRAAARAVGYYLGNRTYAVVGGAACSLLGARRGTEDVDVVVPQGATKDARTTLKNEVAYFEVQSRTLHTYYKSDPKVEVEIIAPPSLFRENFDASTPVVIVEGTKVLKPALILNAKCNSILGRAIEEKKQSDAEDIQFCLWWCYTNNSFPTSAEVPRANAQFVQWFISVHGGREHWINARYNFETGQRISLLLI